jgi:hypothetical protein
MKALTLEDGDAALLNETANHIRERALTLRHYARPAADEASKGYADADEKDAVSFTMSDLADAIVKDVDTIHAVLGTARKRRGAR